MPAPDVGTAVRGGPFVYDRRTGSRFQETVLGDGMMRLAYSRPCRWAAEWLLFRNYLVSRLLGWYADQGFSRRRIRPTVEQLGMDESEFLRPVEDFRTFNEFFYRKLKPGARPFAADPATFCSPADCRILVYPCLRDGQCVPVKGRPFTVAGLFGPAGGNHPEAYDGGALAICRLCPADYHRYHYPADGNRMAEWDVDGRLHSVNPLALALNLPIFDQNHRVVSLLALARFGAVAFVEVGAFGVGGIVQTHGQAAFLRGEEKGYFRFGGSTIVLVFRPHAITFDEDLVAHSSEGLETLVRCGEGIGRCAD
jgi:phosphatidylserine decarboxylase